MTGSKTTSGFLEVVRKILGRVPHVSARPLLGKITREGGTSITLRYEWIGHNSMESLPDFIDFRDGQEQVEIFVDE